MACKTNNIQSIKSNNDGLLSSILVFQSSTNVRGKNKYWQFCICQHDDNNSSSDDSDESIRFQTTASYYLQSRHGITTKNSRSGKIHTSGGASYQKAFQTELQAQKELLSRIHSKLSDGYVWIYDRKKRKFPLDELVQQVNDKLQEQYDKFKNMFSTTTTTSSKQQVLPRVASPQRFTNMVIRRLGLSPSRNIPHLKTRIDRRQSRQMDKSFSKEQLLKLSELSSSSEEDEAVENSARTIKRKNRQQKRKYKSSSSSSEEGNRHSEDEIPSTPRVTIKQIKKKRKSEIGTNNSTSVAPTRSFGNMNVDDSDSDEQDEGFSGFERISTPERFRTFDSVHSPGMVSEMDSDHENRSFNASPIANHEDDESFLLGGGGADFMDSSYSHSPTPVVYDYDYDKVSQNQFEEKIKKLTENLSKESERANMLSLEKNYLENQLKEQLELNCQQKLSHDKLIEELSQQLEQISRDQLEKSKVSIEREEQLYNREQEITSRINLLSEKENHLVLEQDKLTRQFEVLHCEKSNLEKLEKNLNERMQQLVQSEQDFSNQIEQYNSNRENETLKFNRMAQDLNERIQKFEQELQNKWADFDTTRSNFEIEMERKHQEILQQTLEVEQRHSRIRSDLENAKQLFEKEKEYHQHEIETRHVQMNSIDESINEKLADLELKQHNFTIEKEAFHTLLKQREQELSEKHAEQELQHQHLTSLKTKLDSRELEFEQQCLHFNQRLAEGEHSLKLQSDKILSESQSLSEKEKALEISLSKFEREKTQFLEVAKKRSNIEYQCKLLAQQLNEKQSEFQNVLSEWISTSQDDLFSSQPIGEDASFISSTPIPSYFTNDDTDNSQSF